MPAPEPPISNKGWFADHKILIVSLIILIAVFLTVYATRILPVDCRAQATQDFIQESQALEEEQQQQIHVPSDNLFTTFPPITKQQYYQHCVDTLDLHWP
jgi:hypothetical protein